MKIAPSLLGKKKKRKKKKKKKKKKKGFQNINTVVGITQTNQRVELGPIYIQTNIHTHTRTCTRTHRETE